LDNQDPLTPRFHNWFFSYFKNLSAFIVPFEIQIFFKQSRYRHSDLNKVGNEYSYEDYFSKRMTEAVSYVWENGFFLLLLLFMDQPLPHPYRISVRGVSDLISFQGKDATS